MPKVTKDEIVDILRKNVDAKKIVDVGKGVEDLLGVPMTKVIAALEELRNEGYQTFILIKNQKDTDEKLRLKVLAVSDLSYREVFESKEIHPIEKDI